ncbi:hypothetical protein Rs2_39266 [Raphanus sativus]|nr:hypothetical protein Rs2_39266 [Raphanus sativus]
MGHNPQSPNKNENPRLKTHFETPVYPLNRRRTRVALSSHGATRRTATAPSSLRVNSGGNPRHFTGRRPNPPYPSSIPAFFFKRRASPENRPEISSGRIAGIAIFITLASFTRERHRHRRDLIPKRNPYTARATNRTV